MKRNTLSIMFLSVSAVALGAVHFFITSSANAQFAVKDRDYQIVTARVQSGGDGLYILDNRTGQLAVFTYDPSTRGVRARQVRPIADAFQLPR